MVIRARSLLTFDEREPLIENAALAIDADRIRWVGRWRNCDVQPGEKVVDLGEVVLIPGLINAHCHLDYTNMAGQIPSPKYFPDWVKTMLSFKAHWSFSEFAESWLKGARMLLNTGVTTVADIESVPELPPETWKATPLRLISFYEMTGVKSKRATREILDDAIQWMNNLPVLPGKEPALSPHALYSTTPDLMREAAKVARDRGLLLSTHLSESESEFLMFRDARGPFYDWLKGQRDMSDCGRGSPIQLAAEYGLLGPNLLAVHVNYLAPGDIELLARSATTVVHCPRSHDYFRHDPFRYADLRKAGVRVCLGSDSLATCQKSSGAAPELDLWAEMRVFAQQNPESSPREILQMATVHPAAALNKAADLGSLRANALADCVAMTYSGPMVEKRLYEEMLFTGKAREVFIGGEQVRTP